MKHGLRCFLVTPTGSAFLAQQSLDNDALLKLVKAGLSDSAIVGMVNAQPGKYSTSADDVTSLKSAGVSDKIIAAMLNKGVGPNPS